MSSDRSGRRSKKRRQESAPTQVTASAPPRWSRYLTLLLTAICLVCLFAPEIADTDFWWHLKTGQFIVEHHSLPVPDPFAYTTALAPASPLELQVRHFNLTHEWLSQVLMYSAYALAGFPGIVMLRVILLGLLCGLAGFLAARLSASFYAGIAAACATASVMIAFAADRPGVVSFLGVAAFVTILELRRGWWALLSGLALLWANCHGGFVLMRWCCSRIASRCWCGASWTSDCCS